MGNSRSNNDNDSPISGTGSVVNKDEELESGSFINKEASVPEVPKKKKKEKKQEVVSPIEEIKPEVSKVDPIAELPTTKKSTRYIIQEKLSDAKATGKFSHAVDIVVKAPKENKSSSSSIHFKKIEDDPKVASREVLSQEFFRLHIPNHPKTRLAYDAETKQTSVVSKGVEEIKSLQALYLEDKVGLTQKIQDGTIKGLGHAIVMAKFFMERDFKLANLGVDKNNRIVKIDGDWCWTPMRCKENPNLGKSTNEDFAITEKDIRRLPFAGDYNPFNWLDEYSEGTKRQNKILVSTSIMDSPHFRQEVNEAILQLLLMPNNYNAEMIDSYTPNMMDQLDMASVLERRKEMLYSAAMQNESFKNYLMSPAAQEKLNEFKKQVTDFQTTDKHYLVNRAEIDKCHQKMNDSFNQMRTKLQADTTNENIQHPRMQS